MASYNPDEEDDERDPSTDVAAALTNPDSEDASSAAVQDPKPGAAAASYPNAAGTNAGSDSGTNDDAEWAGQSQQPVAKTTAQPANESNASDDDETAWAGAVAPAQSNPSLLPGDSANRPKLPTMGGPDPDIGEAIWSKIAQDSKPTDPNAPGIKPGIWSRIQAAAAAGLIGYRNPEAANKVGDEVLNRKFDQAEAQRQGNLSGDQAALADYNQQRQQAGQDFERDMQGYRGQVEEQNAQTTAARQADLQKRQDSVVDPTSMQPKDPANPLGEWIGKTRGGQDATGLRPPPNDERVKAATETARREQLVKDNNLTGDDAKYVRINGKLKEPSPTNNIKVPSADADALAMAKDAWKRENPGKQPTMADVLAIRRAAKGDAGTGGGGQRGTPEQFASAERKTASEYQKAEADHNAGITNDDEFNQEKTRIGQENDEVTRSLGGIPAGESGSQTQPAKPAGAPAAPNAPAPPAKAAGLKVGDPVKVDGKDATVTGLNPKTGKPIVKFK